MSRTRRFYPLEQIYWGSMTGSPLASGVPHHTHHASLRGLDGALYLSFCLDALLHAHSDLALSRSFSSYALLHNRLRHESHHPDSAEIHDPCPVTCLSAASPASYPVLLLLPTRLSSTCATGGADL